MGGDAQVMLVTGSIPDAPSVAADGTTLAERIEGVLFRPAPTQADERGTLTEIFSEAWGIPGGAVRYAYELTLRTGQLRGWSVHEHQTDRLYFWDGCAKAALYDARAGSATEGLVDVRYVGAHARGLLVIPPGIYHAVRNVGSEELRFLNMPDPPYNHDAPDKYRLSSDSTAIPYAP